MVDDEDKVENLINFKMLDGYFARSKKEIEEEKKQKENQKRKQLELK